MRYTLIVATAAAAVLAATPVLSAGDNRTTVFRVALDGESEVTPGDPDGSGTAVIRIKPSRGEICYTLRVNNIEPATAAHIHEAPAGSSGPVVVGLEAPTMGTSRGCINVGTQEAMEIVANPANYYVNVHNEDYPGGAVRGQLAM